MKTISHVQPDVLSAYLSLAASEHKLLIQLCQVEPVFRFPTLDIDFVEELSDDLHYFDDIGFIGIVIGRVL
jgi:hypothetical protein